MKFLNKFKRQEIKAKITADSRSDIEGVERLTTFIVRMPRNILAELNKHRAFTSSASSSRALSVWGRVKEVFFTPFIPNYWPKECRGMGHKEEHQGVVRELLTISHVITGLFMSAYALFLHKVMRVHKQQANRYMENWMMCSVIISSTESGLMNFFNQRCAEGVEPHMRELAKLMLKKYNASSPVLRHKHMPFDNQNRYGIYRINVVKAAKVSFDQHDTEISLKDVYRIFNLLCDNKHMVPFEHIAWVSTRKQIGNFKGWRQLRHEPCAINSIRSQPGI